VQDKDASILWLDKWEASDMTNLRYGKVGHFLGMRDVSTKCSLGRTLNRMKQEFPLVRNTQVGAVPVFDNAKSMRAGI
jgi:hypothetical protein